MHNQNKYEIICDYKYKFNCTPQEIIKEDEKNIYYENGKYYKKNTLNNLISKEWLQFQKSWFMLNPQPREKNVLLHPAKFPEELTSQFIEFFTKKGQTVLDPMVGTGSVLISCLRSGRNGIGIELSEKYALIAKERIKKIIDQKILDVGDSSYDIFIKLILGNSKYLENFNLPEIDYCITSPPYWDMLTEKGFETQEKRKNDGFDVYYSDKDDDLGNIHDYEQFLDAIEDIYLNIYNILKKGGYLTVIVKNIKKKSEYYPLAWDIGKRLGKFFSLKDEKIWCQNDVKLAPYGYGSSWVSNTVHHYCLNFRKI